MWLTSTNVLQSIINKEIVNYSSFELETIKNDIKKYVSNESFNEAIKILNANHYVIISGIPGIGKTTLARMLVYQILARNGYEQFVSIMGNLDEGVKLFQTGKKQVFYFDDFLGSNMLTEQEKNFNHKLISFLQAVRNSNDKMFIMTTREYILHDAMIQYQDFQTDNINVGKCVLDLKTYTRYIRAHILYNHIEDTSLPSEYIHELLRGKQYLKLINHKNFNPRVIEYYIDKKRWINVEPTKFVSAFIDYFDNPESVWEHAFNDLNAEEQYALYVLASLGTNISLDDWYKAYEYFVKLSPLGLKLNSKTWGKAIKILEDSFIYTRISNDKSIIVRFINPSISDFLISKLQNQASTVIYLIENSYFVEQIYTIFTDSKNAHRYQSTSVHEKSLTIV